MEEEAVLARAEQLGLGELAKEFREQEEELRAARRDVARLSQAVDRHIDVLHRYNDMKDCGQMLLGRLAEAEGVPTRAMYPRFEVDPVED